MEFVNGIKEAPRAIYKISILSYSTSVLGNKLFNS